MSQSTPAQTSEEDPAEVTKTWPHGPRSVGKARHLLARTLEEWGLPHLSDAAELVVSELVTNSVRHAAEPRGRLIYTRFQRVGDSVRIEVHDANDSKPERREVPSDEETGRGLYLVQAITGGQWGVSDRKGVGKQVWAVVGLDAETEMEVSIS
ncbi:ATP-binding protein [Actinacidiphila alni]|uniref:ATP-binding protein n=1 Tax=Actinacidiphila alni TaxID=380248 RepID=UPI0033F56A63